MPISTMPLARITTMSTPITELSTDPTPPDKRCAADHDRSDRGEQTPLADQRVALAELGDRKNARRVHKTNPATGKSRMRVRSIGIPAWRAVISSVPIA